jgi:myo-inositol-1-phosphate synthase
MTTVSQGRTGVAVIGLGGAVATTAVVGVEHPRLGSSTTAGLPFAHRNDLIPYESLVFGGWDVQGDDLAKAAHVHRVLEPALIEAVASQLERIEPWSAVADPAYCRNATGTNIVGSGRCVNGSRTSATTCAASGRSATSTVSWSSTSPRPRRGPT